MDLRRLSDTMTVSDQITAADIPALQQAGVATLIINRPDAEVDQVIGSDAIRQAAEAAGMTVRYLPYTPGQLDQDMIAGFADATQPGAAHAYCRSGTRSTHLWALSQAGAMPTDAIVDAAARAGYDVTGLVPMIEYLAAQRV